MKMQILASLVLAVFALNANAVNKSQSRLNLSGSCQKKVSKAASKALELIVEEEFSESDISPNEEEKNVYNVGFSDHAEENQCFYNVYVKIQPLKVDKIKNEVIECKVISAEEDGQPNCG